MEKSYSLKHHFVKVFLLLLSGFMHHPVLAQFKPDITVFELANGLKVLVNRDTTFQEVALYLMADAGFKREEVGQHGMAHLFEHVMLPTRYYHNPELSKNASQHIINSNAQVFNDYVRYYLHYDKNGLDYGLIALADRLDFQIDSLKEEALQRHINNVSSEIARAESFGSFRWRPIFRDALVKGVFGPLHPYGHEQTLTDITRATRKDINNWYQRWYGASNAMLVILGNVDPDAVRQKVATYFGEISPGKMSYQQTVPIPVFKETRESEIALNQDKHVVYYAWAVPGYGTKENDYLRLLTSLLEDPSSGILVKALASAGIENAKPFSQLETFKDAAVFDIGVEFTDWKDKEKIDALLREEVRKLTKNRLPSRQIAAANARYELAFMKGMEDIGLYDERIVELGQGAMFLGNPTYFEKRLENLKKLTPKNLQKTTSRWLTTPPYKATVRGRQLQASNTPYDFKQSIPFKTPSAPAALPVFKKKINEHLTVYAVAQSRIPVVNFLVAFENEAGLPAPEMAQYKEPVQSFFETAPAFQKQQHNGLETQVRVTDKTIVYKVSATSQQAATVFDWLSNRLSELTTIEKQNETSDAVSQLDQTLSVLKQQGLTENTAYPHYPLSKVHFIVVGDVDLEQQPFDWSRLTVDKATWQTGSASPASPTESATLLVREIGESPTSFVTLGHFLKPATIQEEMYQQVLLHLLRAKLMNNLREKNSLAYEVYPYTTAPVGDRTLAFWQTSVAVEKTEEAVKQIAIELEKIQEDADRRLITAKSRVLADFKSKYKSLNNIESTVLESIEYGRPDDYFTQAIAALNELEAPGFLEFIKQEAKPDQFQLVVFTTPKVAASLVGR